MKKEVSAKITDNVVTDEKEIVVKKVHNPKHYVGTYTESQVKGSEVNRIINMLQDEQHFPNLKCINHRTTKSGKIEVWLSEDKGNYTIN